MSSLSQAIGDRLPADTKAARLREAEGHLRMAAGEIGPEEAIRQYGRARVIAGQLVRVDRGYFDARPGRLAWVVSLMLGLTMFLQINRYDLGLSPWMASLMMWPPTIGLVGFAVRVAQTRRWLTLSVLPSLIVAWVATQAVGATIGGSDKRELMSAQKYLNVLKQEEVVWREWTATGRTSSPLVPDVMGLTCAQEIPLLPFNVPSGFRWTYQLISPSLLPVYPASHRVTPDPSPAGIWKLNGPGWSKEFPNRLSDAEEKVAWLRLPATARFIANFRPARLWIALSFISADVLIVFLVNALALAVASAFDRRPIRLA